MQISKLIFSALLALSTNMALADVVDSKGKATVNYTEKKVNPETKVKAQLNAQMKAVEAYYAELGDAAAENLDAIFAKIKENPDRFILESTVLQEEDKPDSHQYTVVVRV